MGDVVSLDARRARTQPPASAVTVTARPTAILPYRSGDVVRMADGRLLVDVGGGVALLAEGDDALNLATAIIAELKGGPRAG